MKKTKLFLLTLLSLFLGGVNAAWAYSVDFDAEISTSSHDFVVAPNWKHIVGSSNDDGYGPYYMSYGYNSKGGVDGTGALRVGAQNGYFSGSTQSGEDFTEGHYDYLVTPLVNGTVTLQVKRYGVTGYSSYVKVFKANEAGTSVGDEITTTITPDITDSEWSTLTLTLTEETRLAIRAQAVLLDNFTAEFANIAKMPGLTISSVSRADNGSNTYFDMNVDGTYTVKYKVKVKNSGETALVAGTTENYTLSVSIDGTLYGSFPVPVNLAIGEESEEFEASIVVPATAPTGWKYRYLTENLSNTTNNYSGAWSSVIEYNPTPYFIKQGNEPNSKGADLSSVTSLDFGMIAGETTEHYEIFAHKAGDLLIKSISAPDGFTVTPAETLPYTIAAHSGMNVDVTATGLASASGNMVITYVNKEGQDVTAEVVLKQTVIDASKWVATFDDNEWPANTIHQSSVSLYNSSYSNIIYAAYSQSSYSNKFFTPLLTASAGDKFTFDARLYNSSGKVNVYVTKDRSVLGDAVLTLTSSQLNTSSFTAQELTIEQAGDYYIVFEIYQAYIDNLYGLEKKDVAHDVMVNSYKIGISAEDKEIQSGDSQSFSLEVMPAMAETADAFTAKLYANGEVVATAEGAALTVGTAKTFSFTYAPVVTATTVYETYAQIEFTDGTVVKSPSLNLTVKCEPVFVFFNAGTAVYSSKPSNRSTAITFGKVTEQNQVQNFEIYNYGKANLTVKSITVPDGFSVNVSEATVAPAERHAVDITFSATALGSYSGNLSIVYVDKDGADQTFELPVSGTLLDPDKFYATFGTSDNVSNLPAGSLIQSNVSLGTPTTSNAALSSSSSSKNLFITPSLTSAGETFLFDAKKRSYWSTGNIKVYAITDHIAAANTTSDEEFAALNPTLLGEYTVDVSDFTTYSVNVPAGTSYLALKIANAWVDELYGLTVADVAHEWQIASSNIPTEGMQNYTSTATVNLLNLGIKDEAAEDITVTAYVNGEAVATAEGVAIPMSHKLDDAGTTNNPGTQLSVDYIVNEAGTFPVYIEVKAGDYSVATEHVEVTFAEEEAIGSAIQVGTVSDSNRGTANAILDFFNLDGGAKTGDIIYTAKQLKDYKITAGSKIVSIAFKGYANGDKTISNSLTAWVGLKTGDFTWNSPDKNTMTEVKIFEGSMPFVTGENLINIDLSSAPIVYDGTSDLRVYFEGTKGGWISLQFDYDNNYKNMRWSGNSIDKANPIAYITLEAPNPAILAGTVQTSAGVGVENATVTLKAKNGVQYSGTTDAAGEYSINVIQTGHSYNVTATNGEVSATGRNVSLADGDVTKNFVLGTVSLGNDPEPAIYAEVVLGRTLKKGWNAVVLPFAVSAKELADVCGAGEEIELAEYDYDEGDTEVIVHFKDVDAVEANVPFLLYLPSEDKESPVFANVDLAADEAVTEGNVFDFVGVYDRTDVNAGDYFIQGGKFVKASTGNYVLPYRSYLKLKDTAGARSIRFVIGDNQVVTAINGLTIDATSTEGAYNLQGQKVEQLKKGNLYIINGKKVLVK